jgi:hypothetical protein
MARRTARAGQAAIEMSLAIIASLIIGVASFKVWVWLTKALVEENECYQNTRVAAGYTRAENFLDTVRNPGLGRKGMTFGGTAYPDPPPHGNPFWYPDAKPVLNILSGDFGRRRCQS